ncbi:hypothetical protein B0H13DRAFT_2300170 [Mycena leptocephala]|nr:hypothetical protein B0H13DRAFT_2300170 [Mycena leptocephala]
MQHTVAPLSRHQIHPRHSRELLCRGGTGSGDSEGERVPPDTPVLPPTDASRRIGSLVGAYSSFASDSYGIHVPITDTRHPLRQHIPRPLPYVRGSTPAPMPTRIRTPRQQPKYQWLAASPLRTSVSTAAARPAVPSPTPILFTGFITHLEDVVSLTPDGHLDKAFWLNNLAKYLHTVIPWQRHG